MDDFWRRSGELATRLKDRVVSDIFTSARLRIAILYLLISLTILSVAGWIVYEDVIRILQTVLIVIQDGLVQSVISKGSGTHIAQTTGIVATSIVSTDIEKMMLVIGIWVIVSLFISAYFLSSIILRPVRRALASQKRFVANVSHELRTPLSIMRTESDAALIDKDSSTKEELISVIESNVTEVDRMSKIIQFLLNFSDFESRMKGLNMAPVDINGIAKEVVGLVNKAAEEKRISIRLSSEPDATIMVLGNSVALEEMFMNIVKNAIRYSPEGGRVDISIEKKLYGTVALSVEDEGIGIPKADLPHIFEPFYKGSNAANTSQRKESYGLGLAIVKEIVSFHRGTISIHSVVKEGTKVTIRLPSAGKRASKTIT